MGKESHCVEMDIQDTIEDSVYDVATKYFDEKIDFSNISKKLTKRLNSYQKNTRIPGGAVVVFDGTTSIYNKPFLGIIKAEMQDGCNKSKNEQKYEVLNNLFLTPQQKMYKVGIVIDNKNSNNSRIESDIEIHIFDINYTVSTNNVAEYFYRDFMGCNFKKDSALHTKKFYDNTEKFIRENDNFASEQKYNLITALRTYIKIDNSEIINISDFADSYFTESKTKDSYENFMRNNEIPDNFHKDIKDIENKLKSRTIKFSNGAYIKTNDKDGNMEIVAIEGNSTIIKINGLIESEYKD